MTTRSHPLARPHRPPAPQGAEPRRAACGVTRLARIGMIISAVVVLAAIFGPPWPPYDPVAINLADRFQPPAGTT